MANESPLAWVLHEIAKLSIPDIEVMELNEAFAVVGLVNIQLLKLGLPIIEASRN